MVWNPYKRVSRTEVDLRQEMNNTLDGIFPEISKAQTGVLRKFRRNSLGKRILCDCTDAVTHEPDLDTFCPFCQGEGYYWDEIYFDFYKRILSRDDTVALRESMIAPGLLNVPLVVFYTRSSVDFTKEDKIVELVLDKEGDPISPVRRSALYSIGALVDFRSDNGRLEYWKAACHEESRKFLNGPNI